jgi:DNA-binding LytR/AlgR family response regulator
MQLSCIVVDDEEHAIKALSKHIQKTPFLRLVYTTTNPVEALQYVRHNAIDLIFLDVNMPEAELSGIQFLKLMDAKNKVILTTAHTEYALDGYEFNVVDYLLKPISFERFLKGVQKVLQTAILTKSEPAPPGTPDGFLLVKTEGKMFKIDFIDIVYVESERNHVTICTADQRITVLLSIREVEEKLPKTHFSRVQKSFIVAIDKIATIDGNQISLRANTFKNASKNITIPIGATYRDEFLNAIQRKAAGIKLI